MVEQSDKGSSGPVYREPTTRRFQRYRRTGDSWLRELAILIVLCGVAFWVFRDRLAQRDEVGNNPNTPAAAQGPGDQTAPSSGNAADESDAIPQTESD